MHEVAADEFERLVEQELDDLPDDMLDGLDNVAIVVEDRSETEHDLLGVYDGLAATERGQYGFMDLPDRIVLYRLALCEYAENLEHLRDEIHITLVHEIGHFYGIDDHRLHELGWS